MSDSASVLFANDAFYTAFAAGDLEGMRGLWADDRPVTCIHPGWRPLFGYEAVMDSWRTILASGETGAIRCHDARAHIAGEVAWVTAFERLPRGVLVATNLFVRHGAQWRMIHHQAGPCQDPPAEPDEERGRMLQ